MQYSKIINDARYILLSIFILCMMFLSIKAHAHPLEVEGPTRESLTAEREKENEKNRDSFERYTEGNASGKDYERAREYFRDNVAKNP